MDFNILLLKPIKWIFFNHPSKKDFKYAEEKCPFFAPKRIFRFLVPSVPIDQKNRRFFPNPTIPAFCAHWRLHHGCRESRMPVRWFLRFLPEGSLKSCLILLPNYEMIIFALGHIWQALMSGWRILEGVFRRIKIVAPRDTYRLVGIIGTSLGRIESLVKMIRKNPHLPG